MSASDLFPTIEPFNSFLLQVEHGHSLYVEECGNPNGPTALFLHGGPGGGISAEHRRFFDPEFYRIVLFDQRGCGKSKPLHSLHENTTWNLVEDIEAIRSHLNISKWLVFGGSWGSTLALSYATRYSNHIDGLILRGIFLCRPKEIEWLYQYGAHQIFPEAWDSYIKPIAPNHRSHMVDAYYQILTGNNEATKLEAAKEWSKWEARCSFFSPNAEYEEHFDNNDDALSFARIECHYFKHNAFFPTENFLLEQCDKINFLPLKIIHGRYDVVCPVRNAWELHKAWPGSELQIIGDAGHSAFEPGIQKALIEATESFKRLYT